MLEDGSLEKILDKIEATCVVSGSGVAAAFGRNDSDVFAIALRPAESDAQQTIVKQYEICIGS